MWAQTQKVSGPTGQWTPGDVKENTVDPLATECAAVRATLFAAFLRGASPFTGWGGGMSTSDTSIRAAILRAKDEWECTVDALPDLICLLDVAGKVVRINRVVERWELYPLPEALG